MWQAGGQIKRENAACPVIPCTSLANPVSRGPLPLTEDFIHGCHLLLSAVEREYGNDDYLPFLLSPTLLHLPSSRGSMTICLKCDGVLVTVLQPPADSHSTVALEMSSLGKILLADLQFEQMKENHSVSRFSI